MANNANDEQHGSFLILQDGYAVSCKAGSGDFEVEFEATAGTARKKLTPGMIAYIGTGPLPELKALPSVKLYKHAIKTLACQLISQDVLIVKMMLEEQSSCMLTLLLPTRGSSPRGCRCSGPN